MDDGHFDCKQKKVLKKTLVHSDGFVIYGAEVIEF
jgi:hypothetical protein